jgi:hypothetical protein
VRHRSPFKPVPHSLPHIAEHLRIEPHPCAHSGSRIRRTITPFEAMRGRPLPQLGASSLRF